MAFVQVERRGPAGVVALEQPTISIITNKRGVGNVYLRLPRELVLSTWHDKLINDKRSVRLGILEGTDEDAGFMMIAHSPTGYTFTANTYAKQDGTPSVSSFVSKLSLDVFKHHIPNSLPQPPVPLEFSIDGPALLIQLPSWFVYAQRPVIRASMVPVVKRPQGRPPADQRRLVR